MSHLEIEGVAKRYGPVTALERLDLRVPEGAFTCLLGPSGCGKTTLLRILAGLESPSGGRIRLNGEDLTGKPAHKRGIGMVFQSLALFPHMTVRENIAYGLKIRGVDAPARHARAEDLLELVRLPGVGDRQITQLSGGQRQRIAIARALALEPALFLLDEPLSALDAKLREDLQIELRQLQQRLGITTILVTHDQREAMTMADLVVVMDHGRIMQAGAPLDVYRQPANRFVADFLGGANLLDGRLIEDHGVCLGDERTYQVDAVSETALGRSCVLTIRAEDVRLMAEASNDANSLDGQIVFLRDLGHFVEVTVDTDAGRIEALLPAEQRGTFAADQSVHVHLPPRACRALGG
ncbi:MAG: ABC transporter ATP-binding protein [Geminicoccaceae bacterium]